ncbi:dnaJ homolog subfamily B member 9 [Hippocampus comes]|uniref:dnaJ homolog subfamily B member 9 n=1 Tax=Hippocampus comes TaxID=109280 RepID=UPI00094E4120|nr:PREDICTED: dnaJ homolog subfamily B member 9-like [Hippocampus comes]
MVAQTALLLLLSLVLPAAAALIRQNYYDILDVEPTASEDQIKKAFRKLALMHHPDKNTGAAAEKTFREIVEAYLLLCNKKKRRLYDILGHDAFLKNEASVDSMEDDKESFFVNFQDLDGLDEMPFRWSFTHDGEDEEGPHGYYSFDRPVWDENDYF